ncbi:type IV toxin-antitoxin system AbiEi family antitoxin [Rathayibacter oskolensis]|uniref:type IV toxin-antitoxin system AbiEi family antitoxin n=1 Tax=Rathayibacter oskolensis TaxID=1891671 RepID=UPI00265F36F1|nr:type IV toxin-antitoxin system AbiEi family antitoxin [Rathayibacter oskolensis]WKK71205.1 type IV toxin-antitoxin system AbiEi family antitoxin [Rathayibacter oskolensis]
MTRLPPFCFRGPRPSPGACPHRALRRPARRRADRRRRGVPRRRSPLGPAERGAALLAVLPRGTVADRRSAAWVHGASVDPPPVHSASIDRRHRLHPPVLSRIRYHEVRLADDDVVIVGGCSVTTPERTLVDLARTRGECDDALLRALAAATGVTLDRLLERLRPEGRPAVAGRRIAVDRLSTALAPSAR